MGCGSGSRSSSSSNRSAALVWAEEHGPFRLADLDPRPLAAEAWAHVTDAAREVRWRPGVRRPRPALPRMGGLRLNRRRSRA